MDQETQEIHLQNVIGRDHFRGLGVADKIIHMDLGNI
jgi:hypothetical protein